MIRSMLFKNDEPQKGVNTQESILAVVMMEGMVLV